MKANELLENTFKFGTSKQIFGCDNTHKSHREKKFVMTQDVCNT